MGFVIGLGIFAAIWALIGIITIKRCNSKWYFWGRFEMFYRFTPLGIIAWPMAYILFEDVSKTEKGSDQ